ncbi:MAG: septal ring lytic transglycosylase RlpA family protein, partial [Cyanobacteriota bacterium]
AVPRVTVRPAAAPATGAQQVFKQCLDQGPNHAPADSEGIKRGETQQTARPPAPARPGAATVYQVWVNDRVVMELPSGEAAAPIARRLAAALGGPEFSVDQLRLVLVEGKPGVAIGSTTSNLPNTANTTVNDSGGDRLLFTVDRSLANRLERTADLVAIDWYNNLRVALGEAPLPLMEAQADLYSLTQTKRNLGGITSWYGPRFHNRLTANGERFNQYALTAAHPKLPFNTYLRVTNVRSGASVIVRINDRGPYVGQRSLDLSRQSARCIGSEKPGVVRYEAVILEPQTTVQ